MLPRVRPTGITAYFDRHGAIKRDQQMTNHESPKTTKLYACTNDQFTLDEVERIVIRPFDPNRNKHAVMEIHEFLELHPTFASETTINQVLAIAWFWCTHDNRPNFTGPEMKECFKSIGLRSMDVTNAIVELIKGDRPILISPELNHYQLALYTRQELDRKYAHCKEHRQTIEVKKLLTDLLAATTNTEQNVYLNETIICFRNQAFRAATVMAWNLAYDHLCRYILDDQNRLDDFNRQARSSVKVQADFAEKCPNESQVIEHTKAANIIDKQTLHLLKNGLNRRNQSAHPSNASPTASNVESLIDDLVRNVIHKYPLH